MNEKDEEEDGDDAIQIQDSQEMKQDLALMDKLRQFFGSQASRLQNQRYSKYHTENWKKAKKYNSEVEVTQQKKKYNDFVLPPPDQQ